MTLFAYQIFHAVAQQGSFARAAELLHVPNDFLNRYRLFP